VTDSQASAEQQLGAADPFRGLSRRSLKSLAGAARVVHHEAGQEVVEQGGRPFGFHLITEGQATVTVNGAERRTLGPGESFGLVSLLDGKPRSATVAAATPLTTLSLVPWEFTPLLDKEPSLARDILPILCGLLRSAEAPTEA
jgi:CRP/FNR family transcriptional regulator, cyclic AMP receptor protein